MGKEDGSKRDVVALHNLVGNLLTYGTYFLLDLGLCWSQYRLQIQFGSQVEQKCNVELQYCGLWWIIIKEQLVYCIKQWVSLRGNAH